MGDVPHVVVIDPAAHTPEVECFNLMALMGPLPCTYHLPAMFGLQSLAGDDLTQARAIIILGSAVSVHDRLPWQAALEAWLKPRIDAGLPTLGLCYGHQMLAYMYGGQVDYALPSRSKHLGLRQIEVDAGPCWPAGRGNVVVSDRETVAVPPQDMRIVARSPEIPTDGLRHRTLPIWSFQSHPEAVPEFLKNHGIQLPAGESLAFGQGLVRGFLNFTAKTPR